MGTGTGIKDSKSSIKPKGGVMAQLEARLQEMEPERFEAFLEWVGTEQWGPRPLHLVRFQGEKVKSSIAVSGLLLEAAKQEAQAQGFTHGISTLIEYLLWDYLGKPSNLVETEPRPKPTRKPKAKKEPFFGLGDLTDADRLPPIELS